MPARELSPSDRGEMTVAELKRSIRGVRNVRDRGLFFKFWQSVTSMVLKMICGSIPLFRYHARRRFAPKQRFSQLR